MTERRERVRLGTGRDDLGGQLLARDGGQRAVRVVQQGHLVDPERPVGAVEFGSAADGEAGTCAECRGLAGREAHQPQSTTTSPSAWANTLGEHLPAGKRDRGGIADGEDAVNAGL